jgi:hypothetical protein
MSKQPANRPERPFYCWHRGENETRIDTIGGEPRWGEGEEFIDSEQEERWHGVVQQLEQGSDASPLVDFLQNETAISPRLRTIIARLWRGEPFHAPDGPRHLKGLQVLKRKARPFDPRKLEKIHNARGHAWKLMQQGMGRTNAFRKAGDDCGATEAEVRAAVEGWEREASEE